MTVKRLGSEDLPAASLERFPGNPRTGNVEEIRKSVRRYGQYRSILVRAVGARYVVVAGNHTREALMDEGHETVWCDVIECTDDEARRINASDNRLGELPHPDTGERYDRDALAALLESFEGDFEGTGWSDEDAQAILGGAGEDDGGGDADEDDIPSAYGVIVECDTEAQQARLLQDLDAEGYRVRAMVA